MDDVRLSARSGGPITYIVETGKNIPAEGFLVLSNFTI